MSRSAPGLDGMDLKGIRNGKRIGTRLTLLIIAFSSAITLIISAIQLIVDYREQRSNLNTTIAQTGIFVPSIADSVWTFDQKQILLALEALTQLPNIERASVVTSQPRQEWSAAKKPSNHVVAKTFPLLHRVGPRDEIIGTLTVVGSLDAIYASLAQQAVSILVSNGLKTFLVAIFMLVLIRRLVTDRLEALALSVSSLAPRLLRTPLQTEAQCKRSEDDELDTLKCAFDSMGQQLTTAIDELRDSRHLLQSILDNSTAVIFVKDLEGRYILVNRRFKELFHVEGLDPIGRTSHDLFGEKRGETLRAADQAVLATGKPMQSEELIPLEDGVRTYVAIRAPLLDMHGKPHALCVVATDITERKQAEDELKRHRNHLEDMVHDRTAALAQANMRLETELAERRRTEEALRASEQFLDSIVENIPNMIFVKEAQQLRFVRFNRAGEELIGLTRQELIGKNDYAFFPREEADFFVTKDREVLDSKELLDIPEETIHTRKLGERILHTKKLAILDRENKPQYLLGISEDITQRKHLEDLLRQRNAELVVAKEQADAASQAKTAFLASMSHELRTPLNAILGYAQILKRDKNLNQRQTVGLDTIRQSGEHLLTLINDVLDLSKIEAGKLALYPNAFNLPIFLRVIADIIRVKAEQKSLSFSLDIAPALPAAVRADEKRLRQVLLNLLGNAVKFTDHGKVVFRVQVASQTTSSATLYFEVEDKGIGIPPGQLEAIFHPFEQAGEVQRRYGGTGLGLAISRQLVRLMGSDIQVESRLGQGSRFRFELELALAPELSTPPAPRAAIGYSGPRRRLLIVDDVPPNRAVLVDFLTSLGFVIEGAEDGRQLLLRAQAVPPDLIITDMVMPVMDGLEATRSLRKNARLRSTPVIVISASAGEEDQLRSLGAGANAFLPKPIEPDRLLQHIGILLNLEWEYEEIVADTAAQQPVVTPPREALQELHSLALTGSMRDILEWSDRIETVNERYASFAGKLRRLATSYQSKAILTLAQECLNNAS